MEGRLKRAYSVFQKLKRQKITLDQVYDLLAVRIVTDSVKNCYAALGVIHNEWHPIPGRIKDFIAIPRPNLYQSLHTSVMGPGGRHFEVQIRTEEMHRVAEEGIAAHWKYKEGRRGPAEDDQRIAWLRQLVEWQREMHDPGEFMSTLKVDLYPEEVYTFTPQGTVIILPRDATPIDFAYAIHSDVGNTLHRRESERPHRAAEVRAAQRRRGGDPHPIRPSAEQRLAGAGQDFARAQQDQARHQHHRARQGHRDRPEVPGTRGAPSGRSPKPDHGSTDGSGGVRLRLSQDRGSARRAGLRQIFRAPGAAEAGAGPSAAGESADRAGRRAVSGAAPAQRQPGDDKDLIIKVKGIDDLLVYRAKCCNPIRGEAIVGYVTRGKGVAVHSLNCTNVQNLMYEVERKIDVEWARAASRDVPGETLIHTEDRPGILNQLTQALFGEQTNIRSLEARGDDERATDGAIIDMTVEVRTRSSWSAWCPPCAASPACAISRESIHVSLRP